MHFYFSSETSSSFNMQPQPQSRPSLPYPIPQPTQYLRPQDQTTPYYNPIPPKQAILYQDEPLSYPYNPEQHQSTDHTPRDFAPFINMTMSPTYSPNLFNKGRRFSNFNFSMESHATSLGSVTEFPSLDPPYKENPLEPFKSSIIDDYICTGMIGQGQAQPKEDVPFLQGDYALNTSIDATETAVKAQLEEEIPSAGSGFKTGGHGMKGWCEDDEKLLRKLAVQYKFDWKKIAKKFGNKKYTPHFLKMRYKGYDEGPVPKRVKFTHREDILIAKYYNDYGIDWDKMVSHFPNRTSIMVKNRYYSYIRKGNRLQGLLKEIEKLEADQTEQYGANIVENTEEESAVASNEDKDSQSVFSKDLGTEDTEEKARSSDEVAFLKAQIKSLKSLCVVTCRELKKLRNEKK